MNTSLYFVAYALDTKWYVKRPRRVTSMGIQEVKEVFRKANWKMFKIEKGNR